MAEAASCFVHHTQRFLHDPDNGIYGDCYRTSLAMILGLLPEDVPHFCGQPDDDIGSWRIHRDAWLADRAICAIEIPYAAELGLILEQARLTFGSAAVGVSGKSPRGTNHECVIYRGELFDPHPTRLGLVGPDDSGFHWITVLSRKLDWGSHDL